MSKISKLISMLICCACVALSGCSNNSNILTGDEEKKQQSTLLVYCMEGDSNVDQYIIDFKNKYSSTGNIDVTKKTFSDPTQMDELITVELNANKGPDIIIFSDQTGLDVIHMAESGAFASFDENIKNEETFNSDDYLPSAIDAGKVNGKQYILPLTVKIPYITYNNETDLGFTPATVITHQDFLDSIIANSELYKNNQDYGIIAIANKMLTNILLTTQAITLSADNKSASFDDVELKKVVDWAKLIANEYQSKSMKILSVNADDSVSVAKNIMYLYCFDADPINNIWAFSNYYREAGIDKMGVSVFSEISNNNVAAALGSYGVATKNAGQYSYEFLRIAMDSNPITNKTETYGISANKKNIETQINFYKTKSSTISYKSKTINLNPINDDIAATLTQLYGSINDIKIINPKISSILSESFNPYFSNSKSYDDCSKDFKQKLNLYLSE